MSCTDTEGQETCEHHINFADEELGGQICV